MKAAWYDRTGPASDVLHVGELPDPVPGRGEVRVRVAFAGLNPRDVKRRSGVGGRTMVDPRVIPGDDGSGIVDSVGAGVPATRIGERVWIHSANYGRPFGTTAEYVVVPTDNAIQLPAPLEAGACLGVPALTAHRCLFADGPVDGLTVLVTGGAGCVGHYAIQLAKTKGATVIATASTPDKRSAALATGADHVVDYRAADSAAAIARLAGTDGVHRIVDVAFGANLGTTSAVIAVNGTIATYASDEVPEPRLPFYPLMRRAVNIRTVLVFVMPPVATRTAIADITDLLTRNVLTHPVAAHYQLEDVVAAHEQLERHEVTGKSLIAIP